MRRRDVSNGFFPPPLRFLPSFLPSAASCHWRAGLLLRLHCGRTALVRPQPCAALCLCCACGKRANAREKEEAAPNAALLLIPAVPALLFQTILERAALLPSLPPSPSLSHPHPTPPTPSHPRPSRPPAAPDAHRRLWRQPPAASASAAGRRAGAAEGYAASRSAVYPAAEHASCARRGKRRRKRADPHPSGPPPLACRTRMSSPPIPCPTRPPRLAIACTRRRHGQSLLHTGPLQLGRRDPSAGKPRATLTHADILSSRALMRPVDRFSWRTLAAKRRGPPRSLAPLLASRQPRLPGARARSPLWCPFCLPALADCHPYLGVPSQGPCAAALRSVDGQSWKNMLSSPPMARA